jgi:HepT-like protein
MNSSAWDKFRRQQATEREQLQRLLSGIHPLLSRCRESVPNEIELSALAATLHSFYTGVENIFKRISMELDGEPVRGDNWHRELLQRMKMPSPHRPALLPEALHDELLEYLRFRHVFRNAYSFDLDWRKMSHLVLKLEEAFMQLEQALDVFIKDRPSAEEASKTGENE